MKFKEAKDQADRVPELETLNCQLQDAIQQIQGEKEELVKTSGILREEILSVSQKAEATYAQMGEVLGSYQKSLADATEEISAGEAKLRLASVEYDALREEKDEVSYLATFWKKAAKEWREVAESFSSLGVGVPAQVSVHADGQSLNTPV